MLAVTKLEGVKGATTPRPLYDFNTPDSVRDCVLMSDDLIGGSSTSHLDFVRPPPSDSIPTSFARFHGTISTALPPDRPSIARSGYAAFRTPLPSATLFGRTIWNIDPYTYLALRVKSDGRAYLVNLQSEAVEPTDLHQHRLFAKRPGQWETVLIKWNDFVRTNYGFVVEPQTELLRQKVTSLGIGLTDRVEGPFELCVERVWATNDVREADTVVSKGTASERVEEQEKPEGSQLKNRKGEKMSW